MDSSLHQLCCLPVAQRACWRKSVGLVPFRADRYIYKAGMHIFQALVPFPCPKACSGVAASLQLGQPKMLGIVFEESSTAWLLTCLLLTSAAANPILVYRAVQSHCSSCFPVSITGQEHFCAAHTTSSGACRLQEPALPAVRGSCLLQPQPATSAPDPQQHRLLLSSNEP